MQTLTVPENLVLTKPDDPKKHWVVVVGKSVPVRLTPDLAMVLAWYKDGQPGSVDNYVGTTVAPQQLETAVSMLTRAGLLVTTENKGCVSLKGNGSSNHSRFHFNSLFSIQFSILNKPQHFTWLERIVSKPLLVATGIASVLFAIFGVALIALYPQNFFQALTTPQTPLTILWLIIFMVASVSLHEFAHGAALIYFGERVRRIGVMLFYFFPAFFCDVTEAWKLPNKNQRTIIALAGVVSTFGIAGLATSIYVITGRGMQWLAIAAIVLYAESLLNLMPFIKLDGYIALMTYVDSPGLRDKTMEEWKYFLLLLVAGKCQQLKRFHPARLLFGLAASLTPVVLLFFLAKTFGAASTGLFGAIFSAIFSLLAIVLVVRGVYRTTTVGIRIGEFPGSIFQRTCVTGLGIFVVLVAGLIPITRTESGSFWEVDGYLVTDLRVSNDAENSTAELHQDGLFMSKVIGIGVISNDIVNVEVPLQALSPNIVIEGYLPEQSALKIVNYEGEIPTSPGTVMLERGHQPLFVWIFDVLTLGRVV